jgi:hypothetical protein
MLIYSYLIKFYKVWFWLELGCTIFSERRSTYINGFRNSFGWKLSYPSSPLSPTKSSVYRVRPFQRNKLCITTILNLNRFDFSQIFGFVLGLSWCWHVWCLMFRFLQPFSCVAFGVPQQFVSPLELQWCVFLVLYWCDFSYDGWGSGGSSFACWVLRIFF